MPKSSATATGRAPAKAKPAFPPTEAEFEKVMGPLRDARLARAARSVAAPAKLPRPPQELVQMLSAKMGFDAPEARRFAARYQADRRKLLAQDRQRAISESATIKKELDREVAARRKMIKNFSELLPASKFIIIDHPFRIWETPNVEVDEILRVPYGSFAKIKHTAKAYDTAWLTFYYLWQNPTDAYMVINADSFMVLNGYAEAHDTTGLWLVEHDPTSLDLSVKFQLFKWSTGDTHQLPGPPDESVAHLSAYGEGWINADADYSVSQTIYRGYNMLAETVLVEPSEAIIFELTLAIADNVDDGYTSLDFSSGSFQVTNPGLWIRVTS